jgi:glycosyltransferase involved in cell wall biosynthesis
MRASDALLVSLADARGLEYAVPSKLYDCCAVGRPVIVAAAGEARRLSTAHGIALTVDPGDPGSLAAAVRRLHKEAGLGDALVAAAREFAQKHLRECQADRLAAILASVAR